MPSRAIIPASLPLPDIAINADDHDRVAMLAQSVSAQLPYVSAYLERELGRAAICDPWQTAGVSMGQRVLFRLDDEAQMRMGRLSYPGRTVDKSSNVPILGPVGAALIGMHRSASIEWLDGERVRTLTVIDYGW